MNEGRRVASTRRAYSVEPVPPGLSKGSDGRPRCWWGASTPDYERYHDEEWGRPVRDDRGLYERMVLEGFQSGLSWLTILRKRENFRAAFANFDIETVAGFGERDVERLLADAGIVRHRGKIEAAIQNARAAAELHAAGESLAELVWSHAPTGRRRAPRTLDDLPAITPGVDRAEQGAEAARLPLRGPDDRLRGDAGVRHGERPPRRLLGAGGGRDAPLSSAAMDERALTERLITYDTSTLEGMQAAAGLRQGLARGPGRRGDRDAAQRPARAGGHGRPRRAGPRSCCTGTWTWCPAGRSSSSRAWTATACTAAAPTT